MSEETAVLESSATGAPSTPVGEPITLQVPEQWKNLDISRGALVDLTPEQRKDYRATGELPKPAEPAPAPAPGESETPQKQVIPKAEPKPKQTAEERIAQLESTIEKIRKGSGLDKPKAETPEPAKPVVQQQATSKPTREDKNPDGSYKYGTEEEYEDARLDFMFEEREAKKATATQQDAQTKALDDKIEKARTRYPNLDEIVTPAANEIIGDKDISPVIKQMLYDSDITPDLIYALASNKEEFNDFLKLAKTNPGKAIRLVAITESLTIQELEGTPKEAPATPKTQAPRPPAEAGGRAATPPDSLQAAVAASGGKLTSGMKAEFLRRDMARLKK